MTELTIIYFQYLSMIVIGVGLLFSLIFHVLVSESSEYVELEKSQALGGDQIELGLTDVNIETEQEQFTIKNWLQLKRFYLVS